MCRCCLLGPDYLAGKWLTNPGILANQWHLQLCREKRERSWDAGDGGGGGLRSVRGCLSVWAGCFEVAVLLARGCVCVCVCVYEMQFKDVSMFIWMWILWKSNVWKSGLHALHWWMFHLVCLITAVGNVQYSVALHFYIPYFFLFYIWKVVSLRNKMRGACLCLSLSLIICVMTAFRKICYFC